ncbi:hypothetical protein PTI98_002471 [Pleurotus ostreatus]|nr:hypothetical protein PTI98_002471 [Pleurotus ostreatus]
MLPLPRQEGTRVTLTKFYVTTLVDSPYSNLIYPNVAATHDSPVALEDTTETSRLFAGNVLGTVALPRYILTSADALFQAAHMFDHHQASTGILAYLFMAIIHLSKATV